MGRADRRQVGRAPDCDRRDTGDTERETGAACGPPRQREPDLRRTVDGHVPVAPERARSFFHPKHVSPWSKLELAQRQIAALEGYGAVRISAVGEDVDQWIH